MAVSSCSWKRPTDSEFCRRTPAVKRGRRPSTRQIQVHTMNIVVVVTACVSEGGVVVDLFSDAHRRLNHFTRTGGCAPLVDYERTLDRVNKWWQWGKRLKKLGAKVRAIKDKGSYMNALFHALGENEWIQLLDGWVSALSCGG